MVSQFLHSACDCLIGTWLLWDALSLTFSSMKCSVEYLSRVLKILPSFTIVVQYTFLCRIVDDV